MQHFFSLFLVFSLLPLYGFVSADDEASNCAYVTTSQYGHFYAKSVPAERYGLKGITKIYQVTEKEDILLQTYDWYSPEIYLEGFLGGQTVYVVQLGPWQRGHEASEEQHGIAFYKNGQLLKKYSTLDIVEQPNNIMSSKSHYTIFSKIREFKRPYGNQLYFNIETHDHKILTFDTETGAILTLEEQELKQQFYTAETIISQIKWQWYQNNKDTITDINNTMITEEMLRTVAPTEFPSLPLGYHYVPDSMWKQARFEKKEK